MSEDSIQINVALVPEKRIQEEAIELSKILQKHFRTYFILNNYTIIPHITISQARYPKRNKEKIISKIKKICQTVSEFSLQLNNFTLFHNQFIFWNIDKNEQLLEFHTKLIDQTNHLREGLIIQHIAELNHLSQEDEYDRKQYGALLIGARYQPHITITRVKEDINSIELNKVIGANKMERTTLRKSKLIIGYLGNHGTVHDIIEEIPLKNNTY